VERKPQQQTLSIRISDALREFLERSRQVISGARGEAVSTSDVAKILLESAKDDRLDYRLEVADLQATATESLCAIRRKWGVKQPLSRAEWVFLAQYIQVAAESVSENPHMPPAESFAVLLEASLAVRRLRSGREAGLDRYYLGNLGNENWPALNERQFDPDRVPQVVGSWIERLRSGANPSKPVFAGRNFYVALRDEELPDLVALNQALEPYTAALVRLAARGHWIRERRPARLPPEGTVQIEHIPAVAVEGFRLSASIGGDGELNLSLTMERRDVVYPLSPYPQIREFAAMLEQLAAGGMWNGVHFHASADRVAADQPSRFEFRRRGDGVLFRFSEQEWNSLRGLFACFLAAPGMRTVVNELSLVYGEL
jgi:hypothetical protein